MLWPPIRQSLRTTAKRRFGEYGVWRNSTIEATRYLNTLGGSISCCAEKCGRKRGKQMGMLSAVATAMGYAAYAQENTEEQFKFTAANKGADLPDAKQYSLPDVDDVGPQSQVPNGQ